MEIYLTLPTYILIGAFIESKIELIFVDSSCILMQCIHRNDKKSLWFFEIVNRESLTLLDDAFKCIRYI